MEVHQRRLLEIKSRSSKKLDDYSSRFLQNKMKIVQLNNESKFKVMYCSLKPGDLSVKLNASLETDWYIKA